MRTAFVLPLLLALATPANAAPDALVDAFNRSETGRRQASLGLEVLDAMALGPDEVVIAAYQPELGAMNDWDDETRLTLYKRTGDSFMLGQFLSKAGKSPKGRLGGWVKRDLDADGLDEVLVIGRAGGAFGRVDVQVYRRPAKDSPFTLAWSRQEREAAFWLDGTRLGYTWLERGASPRRRFEWYRMREGGLRSDGAPE